MVNEIMSFCYFCVFLTLNYYVKSEIVTLRRGNNLTCVVYGNDNLKGVYLTSNNLNYRKIEQKKLLPKKDYEWKYNEDSWKQVDSFEDLISPVIDRRWTGFETKKASNITILSSDRKVSSFSLCAIGNLTFEVMNREQLSQMLFILDFEAVDNGSCGWHHYTLNREKNMRNESIVLLEGYEEIVRIYINDQFKSVKSPFLYKANMVANKNNFNLSTKHIPLTLSSKNVSNFLLCSKGNDFNFSVVPNIQRKVDLYYEEIIDNPTKRGFRLCSNYSLNLIDGEFVIKPQNVLMKNINVKHINIISYSDILWKLHNYTYIKSSRTTNKSDLSLKVNLNRNSCISFYVCLRKYSTLKVIQDYGYISSSGTNASTSANTFEIKTWQYVSIPFLIPQNKTLKEVEIILKETSNKSNTDFWAIDTEHIYSCNDFEVLQYTLNETDPSEPVCKTLEQDTKYQYNFDKKGFISDNISCKQVFEDFPNCEEHKIYTENSSFCAWGYKGNYCNETCNPGYFAIDCRNYFGAKINIILNKILFKILIVILKLNKTSSKIRINEILFGTVSALLCIFLVIALIINFFSKKTRKIKHTDDIIPLEEISLRESKSAENINISTSIKIENLEHYIIQCFEETTETNYIKEQYLSTPERFKNETTIHGESKQNALKNRYKNILPYDSTRVILNDSQNDYINANYIDGFESPQAFIATQAPKYETVNDFWLMVCQNDVTTILMMTELMEEFKIKCQKYWPDLQQIERFDRVTVQTIKEDYFGDYVERDFELFYENRKKIVRQLQFISWPDHKIPVNARSLIQFVQKVQMLSLDCRIVVHCTAGCGRTGTIIMIDIALRMAKKYGVIDFAKILFNLRCQRVKMVNSFEQYIFAHLFVFEYLNIHDFSVPVTKDYITFHSGIKEISTFLLFNDLTKITRIYAAVNNSHPNNFYNGVFVDCFQHPRCFLVLQQPESDEIDEFWQIIREHKITTVVSLDVTQKSSKFWPISKEDGDKTIRSTFRLNFFENRSHNFIDKVKIKVTEEEESESDIVNIIDVKSLITTADDYLEVWKEMLNLGYNNLAPILVICSDGYTRSGLFAALAYMLDKINMDKICDVFSAIRIVRQGRKEFVREMFHIDLLHQAALKYVKELYKL